MPTLGALYEGLLSQPGVPFVPVLLAAVEIGAYAIITRTNLYMCAVRAVEVMSFAGAAGALVSSTRAETRLRIISGDLVSAAVLGLFLIWFVLGVLSEWCARRSQEGERPTGVHLAVVSVLAIFALQLFAASVEWSGTVPVIGDRR